jgi:hypothetical protein
MEEIRSRTKGAEIIQGYTPYWGIPQRELKNRKWEVVCFLHPYCDGTCAHCWSSYTFLGRVMPIEWHEAFWQQVDGSRIKEIRLTGGEPFLYKDIGKVVKVIRQSVGPEIPIYIFTGGRSIISLESGKRGIDETVQKILQTGVVSNNTEIHLSADEHHAGSLYRASRGIKSQPRSREDIESMNKLGIPLLQLQVKNFLAACDVLVAGNRKFRGGKVKIHAEKGRLSYHQQEIFPWLDDTDWKNKVISSEGLIRSGSAKGIESATELLSSSRLSLFLLPGAEFYQRPQTRKAQVYQNPENQDVVYLDAARIAGGGASIIGWWNIVNMVFCGGSAYDACQLIGKEP